MTSGETPGLERDPATMWSPLVSYGELMLLLLLVLLSGIRGDCGPPPKLNNAIPYNKPHGESFLPMQSVNYKCLAGFYNIYGKLDVVTCLPDSHGAP
ncbi:complement decay-accelerating factor, GPI-anchored-like [Sceloporus undulatus]|uniref:complement decay-accelerating factor, GPI-anchored-like n=1 Tax=Sceloporus undulatus TaxID=8520 RepID=UPI001C4B8FE6|nr:complement decay-accelerating factor, GPI-anchored-like [Sceloporus undulatus]